MVGVRAHASIGADTVGIEEFKHRCPVSGIIFFQHRYAVDSLTWNWLGKGALFLRLCGSTEVVGMMRVPRLLKQKCMEWRILDIKMDH